MKLRLQEGLLYVTVSLTYQGRSFLLDNVILDTGSTGTIFSADAVLSIGLLPEPDDAIHRVWGVRGAEFIFTKKVDELAMGKLRLCNFEIEVGAMDYEIDIDGIVGLDFLVQAKAVIDLNQLEIRSAMPDPAE